MLSQEQALEYQEVAALVCMDLDILREVANDKSVSAETLAACIERAWQKKEEVIRNPETRRGRYRAASLIFAAVDAGLVRSTPLGGES